MSGGGPAELEVDAEQRKTGVVELLVEGSEFQLIFCLNVLPPLKLHKELLCLCSRRSEGIVLR